MSKKSLILSFIINSVFIFSCSIDKNTTNKVIQENKPIINNDTVIKTEDNKKTYPDFKDSNLELPDILILEKYSYKENLRYFEIIDRKGNVKKKISNLPRIIKDKSTIFFIEDLKGIRIVNYETDKEVFIPFSEKISKYNLSNSKKKIIFNTELNDTLYIADIDGNISKIDKIALNSFYLLYDNENSIIFIKDEDNKKQLYSSDLKGNIKYITEIDGKDEKSFSLSKDNKKVTFTYQDDIYSINIDGTNKIKLTDKSQYNDTAKFFEPKFSPDNKYILYFKLNNSSLREIYVIKSDNIATKSDENSKNFVGYGTYLDKWIENDSFIFEKQIEYERKNIKVKIEDLGNKINFIETDNIIEDDVSYKNIKIPEDYQIRDIKKSNDNKKIAYNVLNSKYKIVCSLPYTINQFKTKYDNYCINFEKKDVKSFLYISDPDGKNEIKLFEDEIDPYSSLSRFSWSRDNKFLFVEYNRNLYVYSLEKNKMYQIFDENSTLMNVIF